MVQPSRRTSLTAEQVAPRPSQLQEGMRRSPTRSKSPRGLLAQVPVPEMDRGLSGDSLVSLRGESTRSAPWHGPRSSTTTKRPRTSRRASKVPESSNGEIGKASTLWISCFRRMCRPCWALTRREGHLYTMGGQQQGATLLGGATIQVQDRGPNRGSWRCGNWGRRDANRQRNLLLSDIANMEHHGELLAGRRDRTGATTSTTSIPMNKGMSNGIVICRKGFAHEKARPRQAAYTTFI